MRVLKSDGALSVNLQRDALIAAGVNLAHAHKTWSVGDAQGAARRGHPDGDAQA